MVDIIFTIPDNKLARVKAGLLRVYPNKEVVDGLPKYTDNAWLKERIRRFIVSTVAHGEFVVAREAIQDAATDADSVVT